MDEKEKLTILEKNKMDAAKTLLQCKGVNPDNLFAFEEATIKHYTQFLKNKNISGNTFEKLQEMLK